MSFHRRSLPHHSKQFDLPALTHRGTILDPSKLECLNKNHLMEMWSQADGLNGLADHVVGLVRRFSHIGTSALRACLVDSLTHDSHK